MALVFEVARPTASDETVSSVVSHTFTQRRRTCTAPSPCRIVQRASRGRPGRIYCPATGVPDLWTESASGLTSSMVIPVPMVVKWWRSMYGVLYAPYCP
jgi:hypothetical protein